MFATKTAVTPQRLVYAIRFPVSALVSNTWLVFSVTNAKLAIGILLVEKVASHVAVIRRVPLKHNAIRYDHPRTYSMNQLKSLNAIISALTESMKFG